MALTDSEARSVLETVLGELLSIPRLAASGELLAAQAAFKAGKLALAASWLEDYFRNESNLMGEIRRKHMTRKGRTMALTDSEARSVLETVLGELLSILEDYFRNESNLMGEIRRKLS